jgi:hypothetical protein
MQEARAARRKHRSAAGAIAGYIHELSARHDEARELRSRDATDESWANARSLNTRDPEPCEGA